MLAQALEIVYAAYRDILESLSPNKTPTCDFVCDVLGSLGEKEHIKQIARDLADEIAALVTGSGPWAKFLNGIHHLQLRALRARVDRAAHLLLPRVGV